MSNPIFDILESVITAAAAQRMPPKAAGSTAAEAIAKLKDDPKAKNALNLESPLVSGVTYGGSGGVLVGLAIVYVQIKSANPDPEMLAFGAMSAASGLYTLYRRWADLPPMFTRTRAFFSRWFN